MRPIFVSYRREDAEGEAGRLFDDLVGQFGEDSVFLDVEAIEVGRDFRKAIDESVANCGVLLAIIGKDWIDVKNEAGQRRLDDPADFVRLETVSALKRDIPVIPVLVHGAKMPRAEQLPDDLKELAYRNGVELTHARWRSDLELLLKALRRYVDSPKSTAESEPAAQPQAIPVRAVEEARPQQQPSRRAWWKSPAAILVLVLLAAAAAAGAWWVMRPAQTVVPDLSGNTLADAATKLKGAALMVGNQTSVPDATKVPGTIVSQSPAAESSVKSGTAIDIVVAQSAAFVEVPRLAGRSLDSAQMVIRDYHLAVGHVSQESRPEMAANTVIDEFPKAGRRVSQGTAIDLVVAAGQGAAGPVASQPVTPPQPVADRPPPPSNTLNFAGTWKMFETTFNGVTQSVSPPNSLVITQDGATVHVGGRDLMINGFGTLTYQTFWGSDDKAGHSVANADVADLVDTFTWRLEGSTLVLETVFDYRRQYVKHPPGKEVRISRFRRVQ